MSRRKPAKRKRVAGIRQRQAAKRRRRETKHRRGRASGPDAYGAALAGGIIKMSEVIVDFAEPLLEHAGSPEEIDDAIELAILAWNLSVLPDAAQQRILDRFRSDDEAEEFVAVLEWMALHRKRAFAGLDRMVLGHELRFDEGKPHLQVLSTVAELEPEPA